MWSELRTVAKTATIKLFGGVYETDPVLAGRRVECVFDPFDLAIVEVRWNGKPYGLATPHQISRHSHPKAKPEPPPRRRRRPASTTWASSPPSTSEAARRHRIRYDALARRGRRRAAGRAVSPQPAVRPGEISDLIAWAARLSRTGLGNASPAEAAAYLAAKADLLDRIAAERAADGWASRDITAARQAAAGARAAADAAARAWPPPASPPRRTDMIDLRNHYGFTRTPFGKDLAPSMLHHYPAHAEAVARITWCARERAVGVITGEVGSGKTVSARAAIAALDQTRHTLIYLADPTTGTRGIHHQVVTALGGRPAHGSATLAAQAAGLIAAEHGERGRVPLLVIDEAHLLTHDQLEAVRILTNSEMDAASPLACLLIGQPTLRRMLRLGVLAALDQRIALRYAMPAMTAEQTGGYITHHLKLAGRSDPLFSDDAVALIHDAGRGLPRAVNNLATQALVAAWAGRKNIVDEQSARAAVTEITTD